MFEKLFGVLSKVNRKVYLAKINRKLVGNRACAFDVPSKNSNLGFSQKTAIDLWIFSIVEPLGVEVPPGCRMPGPLRSGCVTGLDFNKQHFGMRV